MKKYTLLIQIYNDHGELINKQLKFDSMEIIDNFLTEPTEMHKIWSEAEDNGKRDGILYEELFDSKKEAEIAMDNGLTSDDMTNFN